MPTPLARKDRLKLQRVMRMTRENVDAALDAHASVGRLNASQRADLKRAEQDTVWLLAQLLDGPYYGALPWSTVQTLWNYSLMAADLLEAHRMPGVFKDSPVERAGDGQYRVCRSLVEANGDVIVSKAFKCKNPAWGVQQLDKWQARFELTRGGKT